MPEPRKTAYSPYYRTSWAIIVGIDAYRHLRPLNSAVKDAHDVASMLMGYHSFPASQVILLTDDMATLDNILAIFDTIINPSTVDLNDRILVYFAGHGITRTAQDGSKEGYLAPYDASPKQWRTLLPMPDLIKQARFLPAKHILFVMDACYSGLSLRTSHAIPPVMDHFLTQRSVQVITAGREDEPVSDGTDKTGNSAFTSLFLDALEGKAVTASSLMTASDLMTYITRHIAVLEDVQQSPQYGWVDGSGDFVFALPQGLYLPLRLEVTLRQGTVPARLLAVNELTDIASGEDKELAALAEQRLLEVAEYDPDPRVTHTALRLLGIDIAPPTRIEIQSPATVKRRNPRKSRRGIVPVIAVSAVAIAFAIFLLGMVYVLLNQPSDEGTATAEPSPADVTSDPSPVIIPPATDVPAVEPLSTDPPAELDPVTTAAPEASPTPTESATEQTPIFFDDFTTSGLLWESMPEDQRVRRTFSDSTLSFSVLVPDSLWFTRPRNLTVQDGTIQTSVTLTDESSDGYFGILFRQVDPDNYYYFRISRSGELALLVQLAGSVQELTSTRIDETIFRSEEIHKVAVQLSGPRIQLTIDDRNVGEVTDNRFQSGRVGLIVQTGSSAPTTILFSDFAIYEN